MAASLVNLAVLLDEHVLVGFVGDVAAEEGEAVAEGEALPVGCADADVAAFGEFFPGGLLHPGPGVEVGAMDGHEDPFDSVGFVGEP